MASVSLPTRDVAAQPRFRFPADDPYGTLFIKDPIGVDHDPKTGTFACKNFEGEGLPHCYDGHKGSDLLLQGGFRTMDAHDVRVVAAAPGLVSATADGNYDRCRVGADAKPYCKGFPVIANKVEITHADGHRTLYVHLKKNSVKVKVGQKVTCGELLGFVGSSGYSVLPHLHFEVRSPQNKVIDPYAGSLSQPTSLWVKQDGPLGRPSRRCADEIPPGADAFIYPDVGGLDAATKDTSLPTDAGAQAGDLAPTPPSAGCRVSTSAQPTWAMLLLLAMALLRRRRRQTA